MALAGQYLGQEAVGGCMRLQREVQEGHPAQIPGPNTALCHPPLGLLCGATGSGFLLP